MNETSLSNIIEILEHMQKRPMMYVSSDLDSMVNFINGFVAACAATGITENYQAYHHEVLRERGWRIAPSHPSREMAEKGMESEAIIQEMIIIQVETWKKVKNHLMLETSGD